MFYLKSDFPLDTKQNSKIKYCTIGAEQAGQRIDNYLIKILPGVPKSHVYKILRKGEIRVNKKRIKPEYRLQEQDEIRVPPIRIATKNQNVPLSKTANLLEKRIIYEDEQIIIINKPSGIASHGGSGINFGVIEIMRALRPNARFLELVHRLDRDTSGCMILAKKRSALVELHALLRTGKITKTYLALVKGSWESGKKMVNLPLVKNQLQSGERIVRVNKEGKEAITEFKLIKKFVQASLVEAILHTGKTHQIRVHTAYLGHPIAGDEKYGDKEFNKTLRHSGLKRLFLHAKTIKFIFTSGQNIEIKSPLDNELNEVLSKL